MLTNISDDRNSAMRLVVAGGTKETSMANHHHVESGALCRNQLKGILRSRPAVLSRFRCVGDGVLIAYEHNQLLSR